MEIEPPLGSVKETINEKFLAKQNQLLYSIGKEKRC
jgi:hypothetical protein